MPHPNRLPAASRLRLLRLEPRLLFDAAAAADMSEALHAEPPPLPAAGHEIAFIDASLPDARQLAAGVRAGVEVVWLQAGQDPWAQMGAALAARPGATAVHLLSHGNVGELILDGQAWGAAALQARAAELQAWREHLAPGADLMLYGCDVGAGSPGAALADTLARLTGADVAASTDATGATALGGDWQLEQRRGEITSAAVLSEAAADAYGARLSTVSLTGVAGWVPVMFGPSRDPDGDSQAGAADTDIVGDATHGSLYVGFSDGGTTSTADDHLYLRLRIDNPTSTSNFSGVAVVGVDANLDGRVDLFMAVDGRNNGQVLRLLDPGTGANDSPNTTSTSALPTGWLPNNGVYAFNASNYAVTAVSATSDPHWGPSSMNPGSGTASDLAGDGQADVFVSWRVPIADLATVLAKPSPTDRNGVTGPRGSTGIAGFTKDTTVRYVSFTQTQSGPINGDLNGVGGSYDKNATFSSLGAVTAPMSAATPVAASTALTITDDTPGTATGNVTFTFTFSESVSGFSAGDVTVSGGTAGSFTPVSGSVYTLVVTPTPGTDAGTVTVSVASGAASGTSSGLPTSAGTASQACDTLAPTVGINTPASALSGQPTLSGTSNLPDGSTLVVAIDPDNNSSTANLAYTVLVSGGSWTLNTATATPTSGSFPSGGLTAAAKVTATATDAAGNSTTAVALTRPTVNARSTNDTTPVITGTWANLAGDTLTVTVSGATYTLSPGSTAWSLDLGSATPSSGSLTPLVAGNSYEVTATVTRASTGVSDTSSNELSITNTPVVAVDITGGATASGTDTTPVITGSSSNAGGYVIVRLDPNDDGNLADAVTYSVVPDGAGNWSLDTGIATPVSGTVPTGGFTGAVGLRATDAAGAVADMQVLTIVTPTVTISGITSTASTNSAGQVNNTGANANWLNATEDNAVTVSGSAANGFTVDLVISDASGNRVTASGLSVTAGTWQATGLDLSALDNGTLTATATLSGTTFSATHTAVTHDRTPNQIFITHQSEIPKSQATLSGASTLGAGVGLTVTVRNSTDTSTIWTGTTTTDSAGNWSVTTPNGTNLVGGNSGTVVIKVAPTSTNTDAALNITQQAVRTGQAVRNGAANTSDSIVIGTIAGDDVIVASEITGGLTISGTTNLTTAATSAFAVTVTDGSTTQTATVTANNSGNWTATLSAAQVQALANGPLVVTASVTNTSSSITVSDVALPTLSLATPTLDITDNVPGTATGNVTFTFTFSEAVTGFTAGDISVSGGTAGTFSGSGASYTLVVTPTASTAGNINVSVAGGVATGSGSGRATLGDTATQAYDTTGAAAPPALTINTDALAGSRTPVISGTTSLLAGAPVLVSIDPDNDSGTANSLSYAATVDGSGNWQVDLASATPTSGSLPVGGLDPWARFTATATNAYGNSTTAIGHNTPAVSTLTTNDNTPTVTGSWTNEAGDVLTVLLNGVTYSVAGGNLAISGNSWSLTPSVALADGTYAVTATTTRGATGKTDITGSELVVDTAASVDITGGASVSTNDATPMVSGTASGVPAGSVVTLQLDIDNNGSWDLSFSAVVDGSGNWQVDTGSAAPASGSWPAGGLNGSVPVRASVGDAAGNSATDTQTLVVDTTPPAITFTSSGRTPDTTPLITGTTDLAAGSTLTLAIDPDNDGNWSNQQTYTATVQAGGTWQVQTTTPLSGTVAVRASGTDAAGNSAQADRPLTVDPGAPTVTVTPVLTSNNDGIADASEDDTLVISGSTTGVPDGGTVSVTLTDGTLTLTDTATVGSGTWTLAALNLSSWANGSITVTATHLDGGGNATSDTTSFQHDRSATVAIDAISQDTGVVSDFITRDATVAIVGTATPGAAVAVVVRDSGNTVVASFNVTANGSTGLWQTAATGTLAPGQYSIQATVGASTDTQVLEIVDATAPTLSASNPADDATGVATGANLSLSFSRNVRAGSGFVAVYRADGTLIESFDVGTGRGDNGGTLSFNGSSGLTLDPGAALTAGTGYYLRIDAGAVIDAVGNAYAGIADASTLNFSTAAADNTPPTIAGPGGATGASSAITVNEGITAVHGFTASEAVTWSISGGPDSARFAIDTSGNLVFSTAPDFENPTDAGSNNTYVAVIRAVDAAGNATTQTVTVTVADVDEVAPTITGPGGATGASSAITVNEGITAVHGFTASEAVTWSISGGPDSARFAIDTSGNLVFTAAPDFENPTDVGANNTYIAVIRAVDATGNTTTQTLTVTVADVDEVAPTITGPGGATGASAAVTVNEGTTAVHGFAASEAVTWSVSSGADAARFSIDSSGNLVFTAAPDFENPTDVGANNTYVAVIRAVDAAGNATTQTLTVTVADVDEVAPTITGPGGTTGAAASITVNEGGTAVHGFGASEAVTWSISGGPDSARFAIDTSGNLVFTTAPDFENPTDPGANNTYVAVIRAVDAAGNATTQTVTVTVADVDEVAPTITGPGGATGASSAVTVNEGTTAVHGFTASEAITWSVSGGADAARFSIDASGNLVFTAAPDFENPTDVGANNTYVAVIRAVDAAGNATTQTLTVTVADVDEVAPTITGPGGATGAAASITVNEGSPAVHGFGASEAVTWSISGGPDAARFAIDASGNLVFTAAPDFENPTDAGANNTYIAVIRAVDAAGNATTQTVTVTVADVDEVAPTITGPGGATGASSAVTVNEGTTAVHGFTASEAITWSVSGGADAARFSIDASGNLVFTAAPDFENPTDVGANNTYVAVIRAVDAAGNASTQTITVTVADVSEPGGDVTPPTLTGPGGATGATAAITVNEGSMAVHGFSASEAVTWSVAGGPDSARFAIDASGNLVFTTAPDFENPADTGSDNSYVVVVRAADAAGNASTQTVTVTVADLDDVAPTIAGPGGATGASSATTVNEGTTTVHRFTANEAVTWSISGGADAAHFAIDSSGNLRFTAAPDFENPADAGADNGYVVTVLAVDAAGNTSTQTLTVTVADVSEPGGDSTPPTITGPGGATGATASITLDEGLTVVHGFTASEAVTWSISGGPDSARFAIDASGNLVFSTAPDFENPSDIGANNTYVVVLRAVDAAGNASTQTLTVTVADVNEPGGDTTPPAITGPGGSSGSAAAVTVDEGNTAVHGFTASEPVAWSIVGGDDAALFAIDATGRLVFTAAPDHEHPADTGADNVHAVRVRATDTAGLTREQTVSVTVAPVDEVPPAIVSPAAAATLAENSGAGQLAYTVQADDSADISGGVSYALVPGADAAAFSIDPLSGQVRLLGNPDFETRSRYTFTVEAVDAAGGRSTRTVTLDIADVDEQPPQLRGPQGATGAASTAEVLEGAAAVHSFSADEPVGWQIVGGADAARFTLGTDGVLRFAEAPRHARPTDADGNNVYVVQLRATDAAGLSSTQTVSVRVLADPRLLGQPPTTGAPAAPTLPASPTSPTAGTGANLAWVDAADADGGASSRFTLGPAGGAQPWSMAVARSPMLAPRHDDLDPHAYVLAAVRETPPLHPFTRPGEHALVPGLPPSLGAGLLSDQSLYVLPTVARVAREAATLGAARPLQADTPDDAAAPLASPPGPAPATAEAEPAPDRAADANPPPAGRKPFAQQLREQARARQWATADMAAPPPGPAPDKAPA